jgi:S-DNA-T family DNA segregation ATPase FtsK/SpoIIIE
MFKYIKRFYTYLAGDTPVQERNRGQQEKQTPSMKHDRNKVNEVDIKARVSYQYPKGNFKFPLISDSEVKKKAPRRTPRRVEPQPKKQAQVHVEKKKIVKSSPSHPFRATDVPSPVYGFKERKQKKNTIPPAEPIEYELQSTSSNFDATLDTKQVYQDPGTSIKEYDESTATKPFDTPFEGELESNTHSVDLGYEETKIINFDDYSYEEEQTDQTEVRNEHVEANQIEARVNNIETNHTEVRNEYFEGDQDAVDEQVELRDEVIDETVPPIITESQDEQHEETKRSSRNTVPFNVLMLKQDRQKMLEKKEEKPTREQGYTFPPLHYLTIPKQDVHTDDNWLDEQRKLLDVTLQNFNVKAKVVNVTQGPSVTRFEVHPEPGVKVNKITNLSDDIKLSLSAKDIRIEAPIPGKNTIGIEVPNKISKPVFLSEIIRSHAFRNDSSPLTVALGLDISGKPIVTDLKKMPHGLIAGATGSGKSVCINTMLISLLYKASPDQVKLLLIDPKMVELAPYNDIPHLVSPVITDVKAATAALKWAVEEMERRYERFAHSGVRDINRYNELVREHNEPSGEMPFLVIIIDELAD